MSQPRLHCALYTRKSTEEGLEQAFNTLDAQREACEAYVKSQAGEGWRAVRSRYDDGGFSGASMERPALKRLLCDIEAGKVDVVVVYKIDRLTRSLPDFARMIEIFDRRRVSFVSVTQAFNTTTSMGRLTLHVLLSFAQFEREVTGERIRDKIAASKAKGMWMGGIVPLGYDPPGDSTRALAVNRAEAEIVRTIFRAYVDLGSVHALQRWLEDRGIRSKRRVTRAGRLSGGGPFSRGALFQLLRNRLYLGMIVHKGRVHPGRHQAIIDADLFEAVLARLDANTRRRASKLEQKADAPLAGRLFDADGQPMSPTFSYGLLDSHISSDLVPELDGSELIQPSQHHNGSGFAVVSGPAPETGAHPCCESEGSFRVWVFLFFGLSFQRCGDGFEGRLILHFEHVLKRALSFSVAILHKLHAG